MEAAKRNRYVVEVEAKATESKSIGRISPLCKTEFAC